VLSVLKSYKRNWPYNVSKSDLFQATQKFHIGAALFTAGLGGIARVARSTARALIDSGADVSLLSLSDEAPVEIAGRVATTTYGSKLRFLARCHTAAMTHDGFIYDFLGTARAHPRIMGLNRPYVVWIHGIEVWGDLSVERKNVLKHASLILSNSSYTLARFEAKHGSLPQARVCPLATEEEEPSMMPATFDGPPTVLIVARMDEGDFYKGHRELIEAWPKVISAVPDARLVIVGGGTAKDTIITLVKNSSASSSIEVKGFLSEAELAQVWCQAHVFAMPSH
jgi:phosphatidylinositol alpha-1,6-mannosyltransferase